MGLEIPRLERVVSIRFRSRAPLQFSLARLTSIDSRLLGSYFSRRETSLRFISESSMMPGASLSLLMSWADLELNAFRPGSLLSSALPSFPICWRKRKNPGPGNSQAAPQSRTTNRRRGPACNSSALQQIDWLARSVEVVDQHDGLFPLIDLKEDDGLPVGRDGGLDGTFF